MRVVVYAFVIITVVALGEVSAVANAKRGHHLKRRSQSQSACESYSNDDPQGCMNAANCHYCLPAFFKNRPNRCLSVEDADAKKFASYGAVFCTKSSTEAARVAASITQFLQQTHEFTVTNPTSYRRLFGGRFQVVVGNRAYEFSTGTSNQGSQQTTGVWLPSGGYKFTEGDFTATNICKYEPTLGTAYDWPFLNFNAAIFKGTGNNGAPTPYQKFVEALTIADPLKNMLTRFDDFDQLRTSMYLSNYCDNLFEGSNVAPNWLTKLKTECNGAQAMWARLRPELKLPAESTSDELKAKVKEAATSPSFKRTTNAVEVNAILAAHQVPGVTVPDKIGPIWQGCNKNDLFVYRTSPPKA